MTHTREEMEKKIAELRASPNAIEVPGGRITPEILAKLPPQVRAKLQKDIPDLLQQPVPNLSAKARERIPGFILDQMDAARDAQKNAEKKEATKS